MSKSTHDYSENLFCKSMVNTKFLENYKIKMKVKDFKEYIQTLPYEVVIVGGYDGKYKHVKVWNIIQVKYNLKRKDL